MNNSKVNHINICRNSFRPSAIICLPTSVMELLNYPTKAIIREHPLRISIPGLSDAHSAKISMNGTNGHISFYPIDDIDEYIGHYSYELKDMTLYLEKIE